MCVRVSIVKFVEEVATANVLQNIFQIDFTIGLPSTLPDTSKPRDSCLIEFPIMELDPSNLEARRFEI